MNRSVWGIQTEKGSVPWLSSHLISVLLILFKFVLFSRTYMNLSKFRGPRAWNVKKLSKIFRLKWTNNHFRVKLLKMQSTKCQDKHLWKCFFIVLWIYCRLWAFCCMEMLLSLGKVWCMKLSIWVTSRPLQLMEPSTLWSTTRLGQGRKQELFVLYLYCYCFKSLNTWKNFIFVYLCKTCNSSK